MPIGSRRRVYVVSDQPSWIPAVLLAAGLALLVAIGNGDLPSAAGPNARPTGTTAVVRPAEGLDLRVLPDPTSRQVVHLPAGTTAELICHTTGPGDNGVAGTAQTWVRVRAQDTVGFAADRDLRTDGEVTGLVDEC